MKKKLAFNKTFDFLSIGLTGTLHKNWKCLLGSSYSTIRVVLVFKMSINNGGDMRNTRTGAESSLQRTTVCDKSTAEFPASIINIRLRGTLQMSPAHKSRPTLCPNKVPYKINYFPCRHSPITWPAVLLHTHARAT